MIRQVLCTLHLQKVWFNIGFDFYGRDEAFAGEPCIFGEIFVSVLELEFQYTDLQVLFEASLSLFPELLNI